jgi:hypothetical protein
VEQHGPLTKAEVGSGAIKEKVSSAENINSCEGELSHVFCQMNISSRSGINENVKF